MLLAEETVKQEKKNKRYTVLSKINITVWVMYLFKAPSATSNFLKLVLVLPSSVGINDNQDLVFWREADQPS